jgi:hypothetical protein
MKYSHKNVKQKKTKKKLPKHSDDKPRKKREDKNGAPLGHQNPAFQFQVWSLECIDLAFLTSKHGVRRLLLLISGLQR